MRIEIKQYGELLLSRPDGREAFLSISSNFLNTLPKKELVEIDFSGVKVLSPGWADEVITKIAERFENVKLLNTENATVQATLKTLREYSDLKI